MRSLKILRLFLVLVTANTVTLNALFTDAKLPKIVHVKKLLDRSSVGFEWRSVAYELSITGINIYRAQAKPGVAQTYIKIDSIPNRFATHYVDMSAKAGTKYFYTFTTYSGLSESPHGDIVAVKTKPPYRAVKVVGAQRVDRDVVKLLWVPSKEVTISSYIIQRKKGNTKWFFLKNVKGRLYPEYVDSTARRGHKYSYRVFAVDANGFASLRSNVVSVEVK